jgi:hypothetical protein
MRVGQIAMEQELEKRKEQALVVVTLGTAALIMCLSMLLLG